MSRVIGTFTALDEATALVRRVPRAVGVLWLTALPSRMLLVYVLWRLARLRGEAIHYGDYLAELSLWVALAGVLAIYGRRCFVRACREAMTNDDGVERSSWRVPWPELASNLYAALFAQTLFWMTLPMVVPALVLLPVIALASIAAPDEPGLISSLRAMFHGLGRWRRWIGIGLVAAFGIVLCGINLHFASRFVWWLAAGVFPIDAAAWDALLSWDDGLYLLLVGAGAGLMVEPFWLAGMTVHVHQLRARQTGEDLRRWFERLRPVGAA